MSTSDHIFLRTGLGVSEVARGLAEALGGQVVENADGAFVSRPTTSTDGGEVGGEVRPNSFVVPAEPEPDELSVLDNYDTIFEVRATSGDQTLEAGRVFTEIVEWSAWPALLVHNLDTLVSAWNPSAGRTDFPGGTTPDAVDRALWQPYELS